MLATSIGQISRFELWGPRIRLPQSQLTFPNREPNPRNPQKTAGSPTGIATLEIERKSHSACCGFRSLAELSVPLTSGQLTPLFGHLYAKPFRSPHLRGHRPSILLNHTSYIMDNHPPGEGGTPQHDKGAAGTAPFTAMYAFNVDASRRRPGPASGSPVARCRSCADTPPSARSGPWSGTGRPSPNRHESTASCLSRP